VCPKCGHFNASAQSKKSGSVSSPNSPLSPSAMGPMHHDPRRPDQGSGFASSAEAPTGMRRRSAVKAGEDADGDDGEHAADRDQSVMEVDS